ncbi:MAG: Gfo/Idh/MocA family oxidoreductase [Verrucomicrobia bacterium]|jgi:predicted dehydrogenase|nr:Gfo/Idh/MocA family oxidoreductase [Verrucomicrobiota bacterium]
MKRRQFVKTVAGVGAGAFVLPRFSIGQSGPPANSKVNIAMIGSRNIAKMAYDGVKGENIVALCDIDSRMFPDWSGNIPKFADYRRMLDKMSKEIDGVCINTPDHTHFNATLACMERGIHVCTQKPLTHDIWQARTLKKAKEKYGVITNMANQGHTYNGIREMREMYEADLFGQINEVHMGTPVPNWNSRYFRKPGSLPLAEEPIPEAVNWDLWQGPAAERGYNAILHPLKWRGFYEYGTGLFGDWFCHIGDGPVWVLDLYEPTVVECIERGPALEGMIPDYSIVRLDFPARGAKRACSMYWYDGAMNGGTPIKSPADWAWGTVPDKGSFWYGDKQNAFLDERSNNPRFTNKERMRAYKESGGVPEKYARVKGGPHREWVHAIKGDIAECGSNFDYAAPITEVALIGVLAQRFGGRIEWDPKKGVTNRPELNAFVREPVRAGWEAGQNLWVES